MTPLQGQIVQAQRILSERLATANFRVVVETMTNNMRNRWARAGYPGLRKKDPTGPAQFIPAPMLLRRLEEHDARLAQKLTPKHDRKHRSF